MQQKRAAFTGCPSHICFLRLSQHLRQRAEHLLHVQGFGNVGGHAGFALTFEVFADAVTPSITGIWMSISTAS